MNAGDAMIGKSQAVRQHSPLAGRPTSWRREADPLRDVSAKARPNIRAGATAPRAKERGGLYGGTTADSRAVSNSLESETALDSLRLTRFLRRTGFHFAGKRSVPPARRSCGATPGASPSVSFETIYVSDERDAFMMELLAAR
jgi:hypothetical protein